MDGLESDSERHRIEADWAAARAAAEHAKATAEQGQASAERAQAAAECANRAKDHFLAVLGHELRTPLTPVVMALSLLERRADLDAEVRESLDIIRRNVETQARLIDDLLDVARVASGKIELRRASVDLCAIVERAIEVCKPEIDSRSLSFRLDLGAAGPYWVDADAVRLEQVFWNLLNNAIKFTPPGGRLNVCCEKIDDRVIVEVSDNGIGIEPEALPRVFDAFEQGDRSITRQFGGLGLGLSISKALVEMHGGTIRVYSEGRGRGTSFHILLPLAAPPRQPEPPAVASSPPASGRSLRVLLVEDHRVTARLIAMLLTTVGHEVTTAADEAAAIDSASRHDFDLLVSDLGLPGGSGHDLLRELRARGYRFPAIALTGYGQEDDVRQSSEAGFIAHLTKPASREAILNAVASVASRLPLDEGVAHERRGG